MNKFTSLLLKQLFACIVLLMVSSCGQPSDDQTFVPEIQPGIAKVSGKVVGFTPEENVVFVYITDSSSPETLWKEKIKEIGGEHYYLHSDEWEYLMESFDFEMIPSYLIFDTNGKLRHEFTGYPGNEEMQKRIEELF